MIAAPVYINITLSKSSIMNQPFQTARNCTNLLKKMVVGWLLIVGMVVYTLLAGCKQIYDWARTRTERAGTPVGKDGSERRPTNISGEPPSNSAES